MTSRFWWTSAVLAGLACAAFFLWRSVNAPLGFAAQQITLTNGTVLRLVSVQYGRTHLDPFSPPWKQWMSRLPEPWTRRLKLNLPRNLNASATNPVLSVWITSSKAAANPNQQSFGVVVGDDSGNFAGSSSGFGFSNGKTPAVPHYEGHRMSVFPRRSPELRIRIYDSPWNHTKLLHEFRIRNPGLVPLDEAPPLVALPLPQPQSAGDLEATLTSLTVGPSDEWQPTATNVYRRARLEFTCRQAGQPTTNWVAYHVREASDATGNSTDGNNWNHGWEKDHTFVSFARWPLPESEPWRMKVEFCQRAGFPTNALWEARNIPILTNSAKFPALTNQLSGASISIQRLGPPEHGSYAHSDTHSIELEVMAGSKPDDRRWHLTIARAVDSTGRDVTANSWSGSDDSRTFSFNVSTNATSLDVWIAYAPSRLLEFTAQPTKISKNPNTPNPAPVQP
jgi:hypothetical protein